MNFFKINTMIKFLKVNDGLQLLYDNEYVMMDNDKISYVDSFDLIDNLKRDIPIWTIRNKNYLYANDGYVRFSTITKYESISLSNICYILKWDKILEIRLNHLSFNQFCDLVYQGYIFKSSFSELQEIQESIYSEIVDKFNEDEDINFNSWNWIKYKEMYHEMQKIINSGHDNLYDSEKGIERYHTCTVKVGFE